MPFDYPKLTTINFRGRRFYEVPSGKFYPSVTTVLGQTVPEQKAKSLEAWRNSLGHVIADKKTRDAADRGTKVHTLIERFLRGEELCRPGESVDDAIMGSFNALKFKLRNIDEIWGLEVSLYSDLLEVAGRLDCPGVYRGVQSIIDFKTSSQLKSNERIEDYKLQLVAYSIMHNELFDTNITQGVILMSSAGGFPQEFRFSLSDYVPRLVERVDAFYVKLQEEIQQGDDDVSGNDHPAH